MPERPSRSFETLSAEAKEVVAENMKERVYSSITLLAVIAGLWGSATHHTVLGAIVSVAGAAIGIWAATLIATRMSYRAVHGKSISREAYMHTIFTTAGLLTPAIGPIIIIAISRTGLYSLQMSLSLSIIITLLSLFLLSFSAGRKIYSSVWRLLLVSALEMSVGIGVILLKLAVGE